MNAVDSKTFTALKTKFDTQSNRSTKDKVWWVNQTEALKTKFGIFQTEKQQTKFGVFQTEQQKKKGGQ